MDKSEVYGALQAATVGFLASLSEAELQSRIIEPLLRFQGFTHVRDTSGPNDRGKDLVACKSDFGRTKLYAIQIKKFKFSGKHSRPNALTNVLVQLRQIFGEDVIDPTINEPRLPDRCIFITPFAINKDAFTSALRQTKELERREISIIDGPILVDLVLQHMSETVERLSLDMQYCRRVATACNLIRESSAFGVNTPLQLDNVYVELEFTPADEGVEDVAQRPLNLAKGQLVLCTPEDITSINCLADHWGAGLVRIRQDVQTTQLNRKRLRTLNNVLKDKEESIKRSIGLYFDPDHEHPRYTDLVNALDVLRRTKIVEIDLDPLLQVVQLTCKKFLARYLAIASPETTSAAATATIKEGISLADSLRELLRHEKVRDGWPHILLDRPCDAAPQKRLNSTAILKLELPTFITGSPGAGKTTLMRRLAQTMAREPKDDGRLPLLLYLVQFQTVPYQDILDAAAHELSSQGKALSQSEIERACRDGKYRVFCDGLDEAGRNAEVVLKSIDGFVRRFPRCPVVITMRESFTPLVWAGAVHIRLTPLDDRQLAQFCENWFTAEPTKLARISEWLASNPQMKDTARTPIIAALLCSLAHADADMPTTEVDLYEQRFELLLGRWEKAKGIPSLAPDVRQGYWHFLMDLAWHYHGSGQRAGTRQDAAAMAADYYRRPYHRDPSDLVQDCISRGLLEEETFGGVSFGHLTYQEYLVARWLGDQNPVSLIWEKLEDPWWEKALNLYAARKGNLSVLIQHELPRTTAQLQRLRELVELAHYTPAGVVRKCEVQARASFPAAFSR